MFASWQHGRTRALKSEWVNCRIGLTVFTGIALQRSWDAGKQITL